MRKGLARWLVLAAALLSPTAAPAQATPAKAYILGAEEARQVREILPLLQTRLSGGDRDRLEIRMKSSSAAVSALATVALYRTDPHAYRARLFEWFSVRDYNRRAAGQYAMADKQSFMQTVGEIESRNGAVNDKRVYLLLSYLTYRESNQWFVPRPDKARLSIARVFRTAFLAAALKGSEIDVLQLANRIDRWTRRQMGH